MRNLTLRSKHSDRTVRALGAPWLICICLILAAPTLVQSAESGANSNQRIKEPPADAPEFVRQAWARETTVRLTNVLAQAQRAERERLESRWSSGAIDRAELDAKVAALTESTARTRQRIRKAKYEELVRLAAELLPEEEVVDDDSNETQSTADKTSGHE